MRRDEHISGHWNWTDVFVNRQGRLSYAETVYGWFGKGPAFSSSLSINGFSIWEIMRKTPAGTSSGVPATRLKKAVSVLATSLAIRVWRPFTSPFARL